MIELRWRGSKEKKEQLTFVRSVGTIGLTVLKSFEWNTNIGSVTTGNVSWWIAEYRCRPSPSAPDTCNNHNNNNNKMLIHRLFKIKKTKKFSFLWIEEKVTHDAVTILGGHCHFFRSGEVEWKRSWRICFHPTAKFRWKKKGKKFSIRHPLSKCQRLFVFFVFFSRIRS